MQQLKEFRPKFVAQAKKVDCDEETANQIFDKVVDAGKYSFNLSHAVSYALITYASAYLKVHYPLTFMCSLLTYAYEKNKDKEYKTILEDCRRQGIQFLPADINASKWEFSCEDNKIRIGLCAVKGFGEKAAKLITEDENRPEFTSFEDFVTWIDKKEASRIFNKKVITAAIFSGLLDSVSFGEPRIFIYETYLEFRGKKEEVPDTIKLGTKNFEFDPENEDNATLETIFFSNSFIYSKSNELDSFGWNKIRTNGNFDAIGFIEKSKSIKTKKGTHMAFVTVVTGDGTLDCTVFPNVYAKTGKETLRKGSMVRFRGVKKSDDSCIINKIVAQTED